MGKEFDVYERSEGRDDSSIYARIGTDRRACSFTLERSTLQMLPISHGPGSLWEIHRVRFQIS